MASSSNSKIIHIFGVTGSIGRSAQAVVCKHMDRFNVDVVSAHSDAEGLAKAAIDLNARCAVIADEQYLGALTEALSGTDIEIMAGAEALIEAAKRPADVSLAAIVGMAGLPVIWESIAHSKVVAIANKEPLVSAGDLITKRAAEFGCALLPIDSEHNAIFQVFDNNARADIKRLIITASGGPFRGFTRDQLNGVTVEQAVAHPNWSMGAKISVDSATLMNKALEVIEAHYLFNMPADKIDVIVHPQSVVHSMVEYSDGSVLSQMGASDMCTPLSNMLAWPDRLSTPGDVLDFTKVGPLNFEQPDHDVFPSLNMAYDCLEKGGSFCLAFNAANEVAVEAFLNKKISFLNIFDIIEIILSVESKKELSSLQEVLSYDEDIRTKAQGIIHDKMHARVA